VKRRSVPLLQNLQLWEVTVAKTTNRDTTLRPCACRSFWKASAADKHEREGFLKKSNSCWIKRVYPWSEILIHTAGVWLDKLFWSYMALILSTPWHDQNHYVCTMMVFEYLLLCIKCLVRDFTVTDFAPVAGLFFEDTKRFPRKQIRVSSKEIWIYFCSCRTKLLWNLLLQALLNPHLFQTFERLFSRKKHTNLSYYL